MNNKNIIYQKISGTDEMATIRTKLANTRTLLAYFRTFIGTFATGVGLIKLTGDILFVYSGFVLVSIAPVILIFGIVETVRTKRKIDSIYLSLSK